MDENKCGFCHTGEDTADICGSLHKDTIEGKAIAAHHKCMQYSATLVQYKSDKFGGFKKHLVLAEIRRGSRLVCSLCKNDKKKKHKKGATSGCALKNCRKTFHYYCVAMNPGTVAKRYRVAAGKKVVILYRVFCSVKHEELYRKNLKATDVVGNQEESSSGSEAGGDSDTEDYVSDDSEPPHKKHKEDKVANLETDEDVGQDDVSSPPMTAEEVIQETQKEYNSLLKKRSKHSRNGKSVEGETDDDDQLLNFSEAELSGNGEGPETSKGFYIVIPSKFDAADLKSICNQLKYPLEKSVLWPASSDRKELQDKHLPFIMWDITSMLRKQDSHGLNTVFTEPSVSQYECLCNFHMQNNSSEESIYKRLYGMISDVNCLFQKEVCRLVHLTEDDIKVHLLILSLPALFISSIEIPLFHHLHKWSPNTVASNINQSSKVTCEQEKRRLYQMLKSRIHGKGFELLVYPQDPVLLNNCVHSVARDIEFKIETLAQGTEDTVKIIVIHSIDRDVVQYKPYIQKLLVSLLAERGEEFEIYCLLSILPSDGFTTLSDVLTEDLNDGTVTMYSCFDPADRPVTCLLLYSSARNEESDLQNGNHFIATQSKQIDSQWSVYLDRDESQAADFGIQEQ